jgi:ferrochelatase
VPHPFAFFLAKGWETTKAESPIPRSKSMTKQAVLLLAHGTPETVEQIPEYLLKVTSGRPLPQPVVEEIQHRYALIGRSPLTEITLEQARLVEVELAAQGQPVRVYAAMRNWRPYIADVVRQMRADGVREAAVVCLAPQNSRTSVGLYRRAVEAEAAGLRIDFTEGWAQHPLLAEAFAERLRPAWSKLSKETGAPVPVLFTAHSVPTRTVQPSEAGQAADPYAEEAKRTAALVAGRVPEIPRWYFAFQSQGVSGGPWIGPTVEQTLDDLATSGRCFFSPSAFSVTTSRFSTTWIFSFAAMRSNSASAWSGPSR